MNKLIISAIAIFFTFNLSAQENMDWCENFNDWQTGEWPDNGWTRTVTDNQSVDVNSFMVGDSWDYPHNKYHGTTLLDSKALVLWDSRAVGEARKPINAISPGIRVEGEDPVISWLEVSYKVPIGMTTWCGSWRNNSNQRNLYISTDCKNWELIDTFLSSDLTDRSNYYNDWFRKQVYSLKEYIGQTIWLKFEFASNNNEENFWVVDDLCVHQRVPVLKHMEADYPYPTWINLGESVTRTISFTNTGASVAKVKSIDLVSGNNNWSLVDKNSYPLEILDGDYAFAYNGTERIEVEVTFTPEDIGESTARLVVTWGLFEDKIYEVPLVGNGISCMNAEEALIGENWASSQGRWFTYTADKYQIVNINSCHPNQAVTHYHLDLDFAYDTQLYVYTDCNGILIAENDDIGYYYCQYNESSSGVALSMNKGETVYIYWPWVYRSPHDDEGFFFNIEPFYPIDGDVCETAIPLTLPVVNHFGTTVGFEDDYYMSPCSTFSNYMDGNDKVYEITLDYEGYLTGSLLGAYGSIHVLDACPVEVLEKRNCKAFASGPMGGSFEKRITAGTYYVIISTWAPPQTVDYLLNMSFRGLGVDDDQVRSSMKVFPNPTNGIFTVSINNTKVKDIYIEMVAMSGKTVYRNVVKSASSYTEEIDAGSFARGIYYLRVSDGKEIKVEKIVIQ